MKFKSLEALRGLAAIMVVLFHSPFVVTEPAAFIVNSALFVDFFFILSGFVMCYAYAGRIEGGLGFSNFLILRLGRLLPLHLALMLSWAVLVASMARTGALTEGFADRHTVLSFFANAALLNSFGIVQGPSWNYPSWSIGAELFAYLAFYLICATTRIRLSGRVALALSCAAYAILLFDDGRTIQRTFDMGLVRCFGGFFLGAAVFRLSPYVAPWMQRRGAGAELTVLALGAALLGQRHGSVVHELMVMAVFVLAVLIFAYSTGPVARVLCRGVPAFLGRVSYSIYLVHALLIVAASELAMQVLALPDISVPMPASLPRVYLQTTMAGSLNIALVCAVVAVSVFTYRWIEEPFRQSARRVVRGDAAGV